MVLLMKIATPPHAHSLSALSFIFTRVSFSAPTDAPNCESLLGFPSTRRSSSPSSYSVSSTSDRTHGFSASPGVHRQTVTAMMIGGKRQKKEKKEKEEKLEVV